METERTRPHRAVERVLDRIGVNYLSECTDFPPYRLDIYIAEWHLCIEVDGPAHFKTRDKWRDRAMLEQYGVPTLRIQGRPKLHETQTAIEQFIHTHAETTATRRQVYHDWIGDND